MVSTPSRLGLRVGGPFHRSSGCQGIGSIIAGQLNDLSADALNPDADHAVTVALHGDDGLAGVSFAVGAVTDRSPCFQRGEWRNGVGPGSGLKSRGRRGRGFGWLGGRGERDERIRWSGPLAHALEFFPERTFNMTVMRRLISSSGLVCVMGTVSP